MGSCMTTVAYISTALYIQAGLQCIISAYIAQNTIYLKFTFSLPTFVYKGNNKITELRTILQRESQNS
jgi:hypothetical protein